MRCSAPAFLILISGKENFSPLNVLPPIESLDFERLLLKTSRCKYLPDLAGLRVLALQILSSLLLECLQGRAENKQRICNLFKLWRALNYEILGLNWLSMYKCIRSENYIEPHYKEWYRVAIETLIEGGVEAYQEFITKERVTEFLAEEELSYILNNIKKPPENVAYSTDDNTDDASSSGTYWPMESDVEAPNLDLGWPNLISGLSGPTKVDLLFHPPRAQPLTIKETVRKMMKDAKQVIAIVMDMFTDVDLFKEVIEASTRGISVYILLDDTKMCHFLKMTEKQGFQVQRNRNIRVRTVKGHDYFSKSGAKFCGRMEQKFLLVDSKKVLYGNYSFMWSFEKVHLSMVQVITGQLVESFDEEFRTLYARSCVPSGFGPEELGYATHQQLPEADKRRSLHIPEGSRGDNYTTNKPTTSYLYTSLCANKQGDNIASQQNDTLLKRRSLPMFESLKLNIANSVNRPSNSYIYSSLVKGRVREADNPAVQPDNQQLNSVHAASTQSANVDERNTNESRNDSANKALSYDSLNESCKDETNKQWSPKKENKGSPNFLKKGSKKLKSLLSLTPDKKETLSKSKAPAFYRMCSSSDTLISEEDDVAEKLKKSENKTEASPNLDRLPSTPLQSSLYRSKESVCVSPARSVRSVFDEGSKLSSTAGPIEGKFSETTGDASAPRFNTEQIQYQDPKETRMEVGYGTAYVSTSLQRAQAGGEVWGQEPSGVGELSLGAIMASIQDLKGMLESKLNAVTVDVSLLRADLKKTS
ncbi:hypothetical protein NDU88_003240 [Pleurodeles waltl]|uniref:Scaffolding anchor of CK1 domain-containing protein n=1 Tax=Pleurodeles waltl TaxID=8319 RepID=A0AAV7RCB9_PLEWA|nr:hypothetical protein NDU88_003240 [Pleurodeles waltl]